MIVIGDVHGCLKTLIELKKQLPHDNLCFTGDLVDRGNDSMGVVQHVIDNGYKCVLGNHEELMLYSLDGIKSGFQDKRESYNCWVSNGGDKTMAEYDLDFETTKKHVDWMLTLPLYIEYTNKYDEKFVVSHTTVKGVWPLRNGNAKERDTFREHCLWSREFDSGFNKLGDIDFNVVGHTPKKFGYKKDSLIYVDTGCVFDMDLTAYDLETDKFYIQPYVG